MRKTKLSTNFRNVLSDIVQELLYKETLVMNVIKEI